MSDNNLFTTAELENMSIYDLRITLRSIGGVPKIKNRRELINEILDIQMGKKSAEKTSNRGRKPKNARSEDNQEGQNNPEKSKKVMGLGSLPFEKVKNTAYYRDGVFAPVNCFVSDGSTNLQQVMVVSGIFYLFEGVGYLCDIENVAKLAYYFVDNGMIDTYQLKTGDKIVGEVIFDKARGYYVLNVPVKINDCYAENFKRSEDFDSLTAVFPTENLISPLEQDKTLRAVELIAPISKGQRSLIISPPKTGASTLLKRLVFGIKESAQSILKVILIDDKPEEVNEFKSILKNEELISLSYDDNSIANVQAVDLVFKNALRMAEMGKDVVLVVSSISKLARAFYTPMLADEMVSADNAERRAVVHVKRLFNYARKVKEGGSITVIANLLSTDNRLDSFLLDEFSGSANSEIVLSSKLARKNIFPAIDIEKSSSNHVENILSKEKYQTACKLKAILLDHSRPNELLNEMLSKSQDNNDFCKKFVEWERALK